LEVCVLANIKSAKKRVLTSKVRQERNKSIKSAVKTASKKVLAAVEASDKELAAKELLNATSVIDKAAKKGVLHKNTASRKVSRLATAVNRIG
jgi:small subunit ribosomal protein S20